MEPSWQSRSKPSWPLMTFSKMVSYPWQLGLFHSSPLAPCGSSALPGSVSAPCSAQHAVHQGHLQGQGEGGDPAHPHIPNRGPELRVLRQVLHPQPDSTGHAGLHREEGCRGVPHHFPQGGEGELGLPRGEEKKQCWERFTSPPWLSVIRGSCQGCPGWFQVTQILILAV